MDQARQCVKCTQPTLEKSGRVRDRYDVLNVYTCTGCGHEVSLVAKSNLWVKGIACIVGTAFLYYLFVGQRTANPGPIGLVIFWAFMSLYPLFIFLDAKKYYDNPTVKKNTSHK